jgi:tetratricopeptide (TPR) repeat protein
VPEHQNRQQAQQQHLQSILWQRFITPKSLHPFLYGCNTPPSHVGGTRIVEGSTLFAGEALGYPTCKVTPIKFIGLGLSVLLCVVNTAAQQTPNSNPETRKQTQPEDEQAPQHVPKSEAVVAYQEGLAAYKRKDIANAARAYESAVAIDPEFGIAWQELGRAKMLLRQPEPAEAAFRKLLALSPNDPYACTSLAWVLAAEKKYSEAIDVLQQELALYPDLADAHQQIADLYMRINQPERAIPEIEKAVALRPDSWGAHYQLGQACMQTREYDKAAASFEDAFAIDPAIGRMNDAAYQLADAKTHLDLAEKWAAHIVLDVELELNQVKMPLDSIAMQRAASVAHFWDTLGWVKFQKGDLAAAEKYVGAAAQFVANSSGSKNLGEIYEAQGRKSDAEEAYAEALALVPATREMNDDEKKARKQLATLLGSESSIEERVKQAQKKMEDRRSIQIPNSARAVGLVQYVVIIGSGSKVTEIQPMSPDDPLSELKDAVRNAKVPQSFPDDTTQKMPRTATLSCPRKNSPCQFTLMPAGAGMRAQMVITAPDANP